MMSKKIRVFGILAGTALALATGLTVYVEPGIASSAPNPAAVLADRHDDPAPQRLQIAQAQTNSQSNSGAAASNLLGGASSLNETYKDWVVACQIANNAKRCVMSQQQSQQNGQRLLANELNAPSGNTVSGTLVLPFGIALESGVTLQVDDKTAMQPLRFRTCLPAGCLVPVTFDGPTLAALRSGTALKAKGTADGGAEASFSISLQGFGIALDRLGGLSH